MSSNMPPQGPQNPQGPPQGQNPGQYPPQGPPGGYPPQGYYQQGPPPKKKHTLRNVLLIILALGILFVGGCIALIGTAANEVDKSIKEEQANDKPETVALGKAFEHDGYKVAAGWKLGREYGLTTMKNVRVTNVKNPEYEEGGRTALLTFRYYNGKENLAEVICTGKELQEGESGTMDCGSTDDFPKGYKTIRVADAF